MRNALVRNFLTCWKSLAVTDMVFKTIACVLLAPLVTMLFRMFVAISGRNVLADMDIVAFFVHPIGWICSIVAGGAAICLAALEMSALLLIAAAAREDRQFTSREALEFTYRKAPSLLRLAMRIVLFLILVCVPFLAVGFGIFWMLLTEHDINFYLASRPPQFWIAVLSIGAILGIMVAIALRLIVSWFLALPLVLFEDVTPNRALQSSRERTVGHRTRFIAWIVAWFAANAVLSLVASSVILWAGSAVLSVGFESRWQLSLIVSAILLGWSVVQVITTLVSNCTFAIVLAHLYSSTGRSDRYQLPQGNGKSFGIPLTLPRISIAFGFVCLIAIVIGMIVVNSLDVAKNTQIVAHRGASARTPENTLAAIREAIAQKTDWIEIDVQESLDDVIMVAHDRDLKRVSGSNLEIAKSTAAELRSVDVGSYVDPKFKDERVPTLEEALELCKGKAKVYIELKYYGQDRNLEQRVVDLVEAHDMQDDIRIISLEAAGLKKVKRLRPDWTVGLLTAVAAGDLTRADVNVLAVKDSLAKASFIRSAHRRDKEVLVWTLNDRTSMTLMIARGVDGIITDDPGLARTVLGEQSNVNLAERLLLRLADFLGRTPKSARSEGK